ncbi:MAG: hypothetical protein JSR76_06050 [Verrucomicrobia bacterium]|nr:hypothetical protein [Verrucomicrobiota bacterium]
MSTMTGSIPPLSRMLAIRSDIEGTEAVVLAGRGFLGRRTYTVVLPKGFSEARVGLEMPYRKADLLVDGRVERVSFLVDKVGREAIKEASRGPILVKPASASVVYATSDFPGVAAAIGYVKGVESLGLLSIFKVSSMATLWTGLVAVQNAFDALRTARAINDFAGKALAGIGLVKGALETISGIAWGMIRGLAIATFFDKTGSKTLLAADKVVGVSAGSISCVFFAVICGSCGFAIAKGTAFLRAIPKLVKDSSEEEVKAAYKTLRERIDLTEDDVREVMKKLEARPREVKQSTGILTENEQAMVNEWFSEMPDGTSKEIFRDIAMQQCIDVKLTKEAAYKRAAGEGSLQRLKALKDPTIEEMREVIALARSEALKNVFTNLTIVAVAILSIVAIALLTVCTGGIGLAVGLALLLVINIAWLLIDGYFLKVKLAGLKEATLKDKIFLGLFLALTIASVVAGTYFSAGLLPLLLIVIFGTLGIATQTGTFVYAMLSQEERNRLEEKMRAIRARIGGISHAGERT